MEQIQLLECECGSVGLVEENEREIEVNFVVHCEKCCEVFFAALQDSQCVKNLKLK